MFNFKVSIIIPNWNGAEKLKTNLPKVLRVNGINEIIVVDDGSSDDSVNLIKTRFPEVILIEKKKNTGFSSTVNLGAKKAKGDILFLLNSDAAPEKDCLKFVLSNFENPRIFSVGCNTGGNYSWARFNKGYFWHFMSKKIIKTSHQTLWASGGSSFFRKEIWDKLGGFDEIYDPFYEEDLDLGYRATKRGYVNIWESNAKVEHYIQKGVIGENFSKSKVAKIAQRNQLFFIWKNITSEEFIREHIFLLLKILLFNPGYLTIFLSAVIKLNEISKKRALEKRDEVISDEEILKKFNE